jgi:hypothetical protein
MDRYDLEPCDGESGECHAKMVRDPLGDWVDANIALGKITELTTTVNIKSGEVLGLLNESN